MFKKYNFILFNKNKNTETKNKNHKKLIVRIFLFIILILIIIFTIIAITINTYLNKINKLDITINDATKNKTSSNQENFLDKQDSTIPNEENNDIINIALLGIDETEGTSGRSDCIMILTIDNLHKELKLSSIIRDSYVSIPNINSKDKINHAHAFGGPKLTLETLNENFKLNINKFVTVNFTSLPKVIDDIGGITLDVNTEELKYINSYINKLNKDNGTNSPDITQSGAQHVNGTQALAYCRIRYTDGGDFERTHRHRIVLNQIFEKSKAIPLSEYPSFLDKILPIIHTNLEKPEIISLALNLNSLKNAAVLQDRFPHDEDGDGKLIGGIYYYVFDEKATIKKIHTFMYN